MSRDGPWACASLRRCRITGTAMRPHVGSHASRRIIFAGDRAELCRCELLALCFGHFNGA